MCSQARLRTTTPTPRSSHSDFRPALQAPELNREKTRRTHCVQSSDAVRFGWSSDGVRYQQNKRRERTI